MLAFCPLVSVSLAQNPGYQPDPNWHAPAEAASRPNPLSTRPEAAAGGRKLFIRNCVECHAKDGTGMEKKHSADLHLPLVQQQSDGVLFWKITNGNAGRGMPSPEAALGLSRGTSASSFATLAVKSTSSQRPLKTALSTRREYLASPDTISLSLPLLALPASSHPPRSACRRTSDAQRRMRPGRRPAPARE